MSRTEQSWREHGGGARPAELGEETMVLVRFRDGEHSRARRAGGLRWEHLPQSDDVVAWTLVSEMRR